MKQKVGPEVGPEICKPLLKKKKKKASKPVSKITIVLITDAPPSNQLEILSHHFTDKKKKVFKDEFFVFLNIDNTLQSSKN